MSSNIRQTQVRMGLFMIFNAMVVHDALATYGAVSGLQPLHARNKNNVFSWLINEWEKILLTNYEPIFKPAKSLIQSLPPHPTLNKIINDLADIASTIVSSRALLRHDIAGRIYHKLLLRKIAKSLATYYTSIPASIILARLSVDYLETRWEELNEIKELTIADLACGSGTLLSAVFDTILDMHITNSLQPNLKDLHKTLIEKVLWGLDVLEYAVHLAASTLVLRDPRIAIKRTNTYILPLGFENGKAHLGSLDLEVIGDYVIFPVYKSLFEEREQGPERVSMGGVQKEPLKMPKPNLIIMNPPFARTGNVGDSVLFGHLDSANRKETLRKLKKLGEKIKKDLGKAVGRAGLAAFFVYKADKCLEKNGVLSLVLPRVSICGSDWMPIRDFLAKKYKLKYIIPCDDPEAKWAWSENTQLSEILLISLKNQPHNNFINVAYVRKRPKTAIEAKLYSEVMKNEFENLPCSIFSATKEIKDPLEKETIMYLYKVDQNILESLPNWNIALGFHHSFLSRIAYELFTERKFLGHNVSLISLPKVLTPLIMKTERKKKGWEDVVGFDVANIKRLLNKGNIPAYLLEELSADSFGALKLDDKFLKRVGVPEDCARRSGHLLIGGVGRLWLYTVATISVYTEIPAISQVAWSVPLPKINNLHPADVAKLQTLWLNSTLGIIHYLSLRQDSKGAYVQFKKFGLKYLYLLDVQKLSKESIEELLNFFNQCQDVHLGNIKSQLEQAMKLQGFRYNLDRKILRVLIGQDPENDTEFKNKLINIYKLLYEETIF